MDMDKMHEPYINSFTDPAMDMDKMHNKEMDENAVVNSIREVAYNVGKAEEEKQAEIEELREEVEEMRDEMNMHAEFDAVDQDKNGKISLQETLNHFKAE